MAVILHGLAMSNESDAYGLELTASSRWSNSKRIFNLD